MNRQQQAVTDASVFDRYYHRQMTFEGIGREGQEKLAATTAVIVGCGAIGSVLAQQLTRSGVGHLKLIDRDFVELNNLHRQVLFDEEDARLALPKAVVTAQKLEQGNSHVQVEPIVADVHADNVEELLCGADVVLDGTDNFDTRYLLNDACVKAKTPWIYCAAVSSYGTTMTILPGQSACLQCLLPEMPTAGQLPTCATAGVINPITSLIASIASAEAIKILVGGGQRNPGLIWVDLWHTAFEVVRVERKADCPACAHGRFEYLEARAGSGTVQLCGGDAVQIRFPAPQTINLLALARQLGGLGQVEQNEYLLRFRAEDRELTLFSDGRAIVKGVETPAQARHFYAKYVGV